MLPRIQAREALHEAQVVALGTGSLKPEGRDAVIAQWQSHAAATDHQRPKFSRESNRQALKAMGITPELIPTAPPTDG